MLAALLALATTLAGATVPAETLRAAVDDVQAVAESEEPLLSTREQTARLLVVWSWKESAWRTNAIGDGGAACGALQLHAIARNGHSCAALRADRRLALRVGLAWMRRMRDVCGSVTGGLRAFASGTCHGSVRARELVRWRCKLAGGCDG